MNRERNHRNGKGALDFKKVLYISGSIIAVAVVAFVVTFLVYGNNLEKQAKLGKLSTNKIDNYMTNSSVEQTSTQFGKTVNEVEGQNTAGNEMENEITKYAVNTTNTKTNKENEKTDNNTNTTQKEETTKKETKVEDPSFTKPVKGEMSKEFAKDKLVYSNTLGEWVTHSGIDIKAEKTSVVKASAPGTVKSIKNDPRYGLTVVIEHVNGFSTVYANLLTAEFVVGGEKVEEGQTIGTVGNTATFEISDEPHLHFEILKDNTPLDPELYIKK